MPKNKLNKIKQYFIEKIKKYKVTLIIILILGIGCGYKKAIVAKNKKEIESKVLNESSNNSNSTQKILINKHLYNKTNKEKKDYLLSNFIMDSTIGSEKAKITIIDYSSFTCDYCKKMRQEINKIIDEYVTKKKLVKYVLRPIYNKKTIPYGAFLLCVNPEQRKEIAELFFEPDFKNFKTIEDFIISIGNKYNLNEEYVKNCIFDQDSYNKIIYMQNESKKVFNLKGTPVLVINGKEYIGYKDYDELKDIIETIIKKNVKQNKRY